MNNLSFFVFFLWLGIGFGYSQSPALWPDGIRLGVQTQPTEPIDGQVYFDGVDLFLRDEGNSLWKNLSNAAVTTPTLDQVVTAGNTTDQNMIMSSANEQEFVMRRTGVFGGQTNPEFKIGRIVLGGIPEAKLRFIANDDVLYTDKPFFEMEGSGTVASLRSVVGSNYEAFVGSQVQPTFRLATVDLDVGPGITQSSRLEFGEGGNVATDVFLERLGESSNGSQNLAVTIGGSIKQQYFADAVLKPSGIVDSWQNTASDPSNPAGNDIKVYNKNGELGQLNAAGTFTSFATISSGAFTPQVVDAGGSATYTHTATGSYYRIGDLVHFKISYSITGISGVPTGRLHITGLPFNCEPDHGVTVVEGVNLGRDFYSVIGHTISPSTIEFWYQPDFDDDLEGFQAPNVATSGPVLLSGTYIVE